MEQNNLRIGNYISYRDEFVCKVASLGYTFATENELNIQVGSDSIKEYNPIPLTEKWALRFGFEKKSRVSYSIKGIKLLFDEASGTINLYILNWPIADNLKYVHQLQNLYFALTGEELEIKETSTT